MEFCTWCCFLCLSFFVALLLLRSWSNNGAVRRPPGPPGWPIVGNMFDLGTLPHQSLYEFRYKYGPVLWLRLGSVNTMVVQSAKAAAELFKNHDQAFCDRTCPNVFTAHNYHHGTLAFAPYGQHWRVLRRLANTELLLNKRVANTAPMRRKCLDDMVRYMAEDSEAAVARGESGAVEVGLYLFVMAFNVMGNMTLSKDLVDSRSEKGREFFDAMNKVMQWMGTPNVADFLPWLKWLDPQGLKKKMTQDLGQALSIIAALVRERMDETHISSENGKNDFLDALLNYQGDGREGSSKFSSHNIIIVILEMFFGGTETTGGSLEWGMTELIKNPKVMRKAQDELDRVIGRKRKVEESDMDKLPYLQAVIKEVLRLHPVIPLLVPRNTLEDTKFMGYLIPKNTQVFVNAWAIGRDPDSWDDPLSFKPERFIDSDIGFKGQNYEFIPFGSGRRICVGMSLAHKVMEITLATLLHCFDWELEAHLSPETLDMRERIGITVRKYVPLEAIPKKRNL